MLHWEHEREVSIYDNIKENNFLSTSIMVKKFALDIGREKGKIGIEYDGPYHYLQETGGEENLLDGNSIFKRRLLKRMGWKMVHIYYRDWNKCETFEARKEFLASKMDESNISFSSELCIENN